MTWFDEDNSDGSGHGIYGQRYEVSSGSVTPVSGFHPDGSAAAGNFRINATTNASQYYQVIEALPDGGYVVAWVSDVGDDEGTAVRAQIYNANGSLRGGEFQVNTITWSDQRDPAIAVSADGSFVVAWLQYRGNSQYDVVANRFSASGAMLGEQFLLNTTKTTAHVEDFAHRDRRRLRRDLERLRPGRQRQWDTSPTVPDRSGPRSGGCGRANTHDVQRVRIAGYGHRTECFGPSERSRYAHARNAAA